MADTGRVLGNDTETRRATVVRSPIVPGASDYPLRIDWHAGTIEDPITLAESLVAEAGWIEASFRRDGPNPPYVRIGGKSWAALTEFEPCFTSASRDRFLLLHSKVSIVDLFERYDAIMVEPLAFEDSLGPDQGTEAVFPFGVWLEIRGVGFDGVTCWGKRQGEVLLPLEALSVASAIWLRKGVPPTPHNVDET